MEAEPSRKGNETYDQKCQLKYINEFMFCRLLEKSWTVFKIDYKEPSILAAVIGSFAWESCLETQKSKTELKRVFSKIQRKKHRSNIVYTNSDKLYIGNSSFR